MKKKQKYHLYVIGLKNTALENKKCVKQNPDFVPGPNSRCYYVGSTSQTPEIRYEKHITGYRTKNGHKISSPIVEEHGFKKNGLRPSQYKKYNPIYAYDKKEVEKLEKELAIKLRKKGHFVYQK